MHGQTNKLTRRVETPPQNPYLDDFAQGGGGRRLLNDEVLNDSSDSGSVRLEGTVNQKSFCVERRVIRTG